MDTRISERDLEQLSAFLDGQINTNDRQRLEARLQAEEDLRLAYEQLQRTRSVVRNAPKIRAPRNYTLSPQMVKAKLPQRRSYPILGFASALATVLFVLVLLSDSLVSQGLRPISLLASDAPAGEVVEELLQAPVEEAAPMPQSVPPETSRETQGEGPTETPEEPALAMEMLQATPGPTPCDDLSAGSPCGYLAPDSDLEIPAEAPASRVFEQEPLRQLAAARVVLRVIEIALVLIAISSGIAAYIFYRRHL